MVCSVGYHPHELVLALQQFAAFLELFQVTLVEHRLETIVFLSLKDLLLLPSLLTFHDDNFVSTAGVHRVLVLIEIYPQSLCSWFGVGHLEIVLFNDFTFDTIVECTLFLLLLLVVLFTELDQLLAKLYSLFMLSSFILNQARFRRYFSLIRVFWLKDRDGVGSPRVASDYGVEPFG